MECFTSQDLRSYSFYFRLIWIFDFGPKKLSGPWRNGPQDSKSLDMQPNWDGFFKFWIYLCGKMTKQIRYKNVPDTL